MGMYLRKSFRLGPLRFNLSKSGVGLSGGVKGARVGINSRGRGYVHGGRHGLYYRKSLSGKSASPRQAGGGGCGSLLAGVLLLLAGFWVLMVFLERPWIPLTGFGLVGVVLGVRWGWNCRRRLRISGCKRELDRALVDAASAPSPEEVERLREACARAGLTEALRADIHQAVLDRVIDDRRVTPEEAARLRASESVLALEGSTLRRLRQEVFTAAWLEAVGDRRITRAELAWIEDVLEGLEIPRDEVREELALVHELIEAQNLSAPLPAMARGEHDPHLQQSETLYDARSAQVWSRRGRGENRSWRVHREGVLLLTDKRVMVVGGGTTQLRLDDLTDVEVDLDEGLLVLHKRGVGRPTWIRTAQPFLAGRMVEMAMSA